MHLFKVNPELKNINKWLIVSKLSCNCELDFFYRSTRIDDLLRKMVP